MGLKKLSYVVSKEVVKTKFSKLNMKVKSLEKKISDATTLIDIAQYNTDKKVWRKKIADVYK